MMLRTLARGWRSRLALALVATVGQPTLNAPLHAHERGRPVPLVSRQAIGSYMVSVWSTPDAGNGTVYVVAHESHGGTTNIPEAVRVTLRRHPHGDSTTYFLSAQDVSNGARFVTPVYLDRSGTWDLDVHLIGAAGDAHLRTSMLVAVPGAPSGPTLLLFATPFVLVTALWGRVRWLRRAARPSSSFAVSPL